ncbi:NAD(P)-binding protein [Periconia macrospinosa]|uniref:NAD(P)-binding protein n=1 Tax=Periconia macrospinosa TaxID=97972 RepID=A0A2V1D729_9PLEO|nr:NAD(P)-binding protein [Periconia macrospinosa]
MADNGNIDPNMFTTPFQLTKSLHRDVYAAVDPAKHKPYAEGKVILIVGASGGLGYATALTWSNAGAKGIVLVGRDTKKLERAASELKTETLVAAGDMADEATVKKIYDQAIAKFGNLDVVVNAAGTMNGSGLISQVAPSQWWSDYESHVKGTYNLAHYFINATGGKGTFINLVSLGASFLNPGMSSYGPANLAAIRLGEFLDLEQPDIRVFSVHPGIVEAAGDRGMVVDNFTPFAKDKQALTAALTLYLMKPEADFLRGSYLSVNWDVEEMEKHKDEILEGKLLKLGFIGAKLGPEGHPWNV